MKILYIRLTYKAHNMPRIIAWHLKLSPIFTGIAAANDLDGKSDDEVRAVFELESAIGTGHPSRRPHHCSPRTVLCDKQRREQRRENNVPRLDILH